MTTSNEEKIHYMLLLMFTKKEIIHIDSKKVQ